MIVPSLSLTKTYTEGRDIKKHINGRRIINAQVKTEYGTIFVHF